MNLETITSMWNKDSAIDDTLLDDASLQIPTLHAKYLDLYNQTKLLMSKAVTELKTLEHQRWLYYSGKYVPDDEPAFEYKVIKSDVIHWVQVDERVLKVQGKIDYYQVMLDALSDIMKQINQRNYVIKNAIDWRRFTTGV